MTHLKLVSRRNYLLIRIVLFLVVSCVGECRPASVLATTNCEGQDVAQVRYLKNIVSCAEIVC